MYRQYSWIRRFSGGGGKGTGTGWESQSGFFFRSAEFQNGVFPAERTFTLERTFILEPWSKQNSVMRWPFGTPE